MGIDLVPVPPIRDLSTPQAVQRLVSYLHENATALQRLSDNADTPDAPTAIAVRQGTGKVVEVTVTFAEPPDLQWGSTELWRSTTNDVATATQIKNEKTHDFNDSNVSFATTYYYWARLVSASNTALVSGWSPSSGHSITVSQVLTADVANSNITTIKVADNAITVNASYSNDNFEGVTSEEEVGTVTITTDGGRAEVHGSCQGVVQNDGSASTWTRLSVRLRKDSISGSILREMEIYIPSDVYVSLPVTLVGLDSSPASSQTYKLTAQRESGDATCGVELRRMNAENRKK